MLRLKVHFKSRKKAMLIGQLAKTAGVPASAIRYWESAGILPTPRRVHGRRLYGPESVHRLALVRLAQDCGFRVEEIRELLHGFYAETKPPRRWQVMAARKL